MEGVVEATTTENVNDEVTIEVTEKPEKTDKLSKKILEL